MQRKAALFFCLFIALFFLSSFFVHPALSEEPSKGETPLEQNREEIIKNIEDLEHGLRMTRGCVSEAKTSEELAKCHEKTKLKRYEEVQDKLFELGKSWEERRIDRERPAR